MECDTSPVITSLLALMVGNIIHDIISAMGMISYRNISGLSLFNGSYLTVLQTTICQL